MHSYGWWVEGTEKVVAKNVYARQLFSSKSSQHKDYTSLTKGSLVNVQIEVLTSSDLIEDTDSESINSQVSWENFQGDPHLGLCPSHHPGNSTKVKKHKDDNKTCEGLNRKSNRQYDNNMKI